MACHTCTLPEATRKAKETATPAKMDENNMTSFLRSIRSAITPAQGPIISVGRPLNPAAVPDSRAEPLRSHTSQLRLIS